MRRLAVLGATAVVLAGCGSSSEGREVTPSPRVTVEYRDGAYSAEGSYGSLPSSIGVSLTLEDGVVTAVQVETRATNPTSLDLQERFAEAVPDVVVGRPIADLEVGKLAGSSGTPVGFNDALDQIRATAEI